jgi:hypothetical protein
MSQHPFTNLWPNYTVDFQNISYDIWIFNFNSLENCGANWSVFRYFNLIWNLEYINLQN